MKSFRQHLGKEDIDQELVETITQILFLQENSDEIFTDGVLSEGAIDNVLSKTGLHIKKSKGLIGYLKSAGIGVAKIFVAATKKDKEAVKEVMRSVKKGDVLDFLLRLDMATLHIITTPIHFIDAVTGWHLWAAVQEKVETSKDFAKKIKDAIGVVKTNIIKVIVDKKKVLRYRNLLNVLEKDVVAA